MTPLEHIHALLHANGPTARPLGELSVLERYQIQRWLSALEPTAAGVQRLSLAISVGEIPSGPPDAMWHELLRRVGNQRGGRIEPLLELLAVLQRAVPRGAPASIAGAVMTPPVRVFLSYSHDTPDHETAVLDLCNRLRKDGIDAWIDRYEPNPPQGWPRWMQEQIERARFILLVCTETYRRRFEGREEAGKGKGATWEGLLAQQVLYEAGTRNEKLIPVLLEGSSEDHISLPLKAYTHYRLPTGYDALLRSLLRQPEVVVPPLGQVRSPPPVTAVAPLPTPPVVSDGLPQAVGPGSTTGGASSP